MDLSAFCGGILRLHNFIFNSPFERTVICPRTQLSLYLVEYCLESVEKYSEGKIHKSETEPRNGRNVNTVYFYSSGEIFETVARSLVSINGEHMIASVSLDFVLPA